MKLYLTVFAAWLCVFLNAPAVADGTTAKWHAAFPIQFAPDEVYFQANYMDELGRPHKQEVWRQSDVRLRRKTDELIDLYIEKSSSGEYEYRLIDYGRKVVIRADRTALYRIGVFTDWIELAHVLKVPRGEYNVADSPRQSTPMVNEQCNWKRLLINSAISTSDVCWSARWGIPLEIRKQDGLEWPVQFSVEKVGSFHPAALFVVVPEGFLTIDAGSAPDISD